MHHLKIYNWKYWKHKKLYHQALIVSQNLSILLHTTNTKAFFLFCPSSKWSHAATFFSPTQPSDCDEVLLWCVFKAAPALYQNNKLMSLHPKVQEREIIYLWFDFNISLLEKHKDFNSYLGCVPRTWFWFQREWSRDRNSNVANATNPVGYSNRFTYLSISLCHVSGHQEIFSVMTAIYEFIQRNSLHTESIKKKLFCIHGRITNGFSCFVTYT